MVETTATKFGILWKILTPALQIGAYWFVFAIGFKGSSEVQGVPYLPWLIAGIIPWFLFSRAIVSGSNSIYSNAYIFQRVKFPLGIVPVFVILSEFLTHIIEVLIAIFILVCFGLFPGLYVFQLFYYMIAGFLFMLALSYVTSAIAMLSRDFQKLLQSMIRLLFFMTPIMWPATDSTRFNTILKINPLYYLISGYRDSLLFDIPITAHPLYTAYFWGLLIAMLIFGITIHMRFRKDFVDLL